MSTDKRRAFPTQFEHTRFEMFSGFRSEKSTHSLAASKL